jgi:hypothetical protein
LIGFGFSPTLSSTDGLGLGFHLRASKPVNDDLSFTLGTGFSAFVLEGRDNASYVLTPQASVIVTLPGSSSKAPYFLTGIGGMVPLSDDTDGGPTFHFGLGWVQQLSDTVLFYELDPALVIGASKVTVAIPFRIGVIF